MYTIHINSTSSKTNKQTNKKTTWEYNFANWEMNKKKKLKLEKGGIKS